MRTVILIVAICVTAPLTAAAQSVADACAAVARVTVGQWAEYRLTVPQMGSDPMQLRMAIVGSKAVDGEDHHWHEIKVASRQGTMIMHLLVPTFPYEMTDVADMVVKVGDQPAMRLPPEMGALMTQRAGAGSSLARTALNECTAATLEGRENITVPGGTFEAMRLRATGAEDVEMWVVPDLPFGVVQMRAASGEAMILVGHGKDAKSSITETPREVSGR